MEVMEEEPGLLEKLRTNTDFMKNGLKEAGFSIEETVTPIIPVLIGDDKKTFKMTGILEDEGVIVNPIVPPAVPKKSSLIRISIMASLSEAELQKGLDRFRLAGKKSGVI